MAGLFVTGGQQKSVRSQLSGGQDWGDYHKGVILGLDPSTGECHKAVEYISPPQAAAHESQSLFKTGAIEGDRLYVCTQTEVMVYLLPHFELLHYISLPCFNDLHHVRPLPDGNLLLANTGLDMVMVITLDGVPVREWSVTGADPWARFSRTTDYRGIDTKPHRAHPNHVFCVGDQIWATRLQCKDAVCVTEPGRRIDLEVGLPHDGVVHRGFIYFTTVNGFVVIVNQQTLKVEETIDLNAIHGAEVQLGWCRGVLIVNNSIWIGFSRLRSTRFRENVKWAIQGFKTVLPTRLARYDLATRQCVDEIDLERYGLNAVYGIFSGFAVPVAATSMAVACSAMSDDPRQRHFAVAPTLSV